MRQQNIQMYQKDIITLIRRFKGTVTSDNSSWFIIMNFELWAPTLPCALFFRRRARNQRLVSPPQRHLPLQWSQSNIIMYKTPAKLSEKRPPPLHPLPRPRQSSPWRVLVGTYTKCARAVNDLIDNRAHGSWIYTTDVCQHVQLTFAIVSRPPPWPTAEQNPAAEQLTYLKSCIFFSFLEKSLFDRLLILNLFFEDVQVNKAFPLIWIILQAVSKEKGN